MSLKPIIRSAPASSDTRICKHPLFMPLIPAKAGIQGGGANDWVPAFAGTSEKESAFDRISLSP
jgi:hypothetical protein